MTSGSGADQRDMILGCQRVWDCPYSAEYVQCQSELLLRCCGRGSTAVGDHSGILLWDVQVSPPSGSRGFGIGADMAGGVHSVVPDQRRCRNWLVGVYGGGYR